jgi:hypothetical protein
VLENVALALAAVMLAAAPALAQTGSTLPRSPLGVPSPPDPRTGLPSSAPPPRPPLPTPRIDPSPSPRAGQPITPSTVDPRTGLPR